MARIMAVGAHPDDIEIGAGATLAKLVDQGHEVFVVDLTDGEETPMGDRKIRAQETAKACQILGIRNRVCLDLPNRVLMDTEEARRKLAVEMRGCQPDIVLGHTDDDVHPDHVAAFSIIRGAILLSRIHKIDLPHKPWKPGKFYQYFACHLRKQYMPSMLMKVEPKYYKRKIEAVLAYESQFVWHEPNRVIEQILETRMREFGHQAFCEFAEPFSCLEPVALTSFSELL